MRRSFVAPLDDGRAQRWARFPPCRPNNTKHWAKTFGDRTVIKLYVSRYLLTENSELFTLTYGALVVQLIKDYEDYEQVNIQLEKMCVWPENLPKGIQHRNTLDRRLPSA